MEPLRQIKPHGFVYPVGPDPDHTSQGTQQRFYEHEARLCGAFGCGLPYEAPIHWFPAPIPSSWEVFAPEILQQLTVKDIQQLTRVMEIMGKFRVNLQTVVMSLEALRPFGTWRFADGTALDEVLEEYNKMAEHDGWRWTPPSERAKGGS